MNNKTLSRLEALELMAGVNLPPVLCIDGTEAPASLWNKGVTLIEAKAVNASMRELIAVLDAPAPCRKIEDFV